MSRVFEMCEIFKRLTSLDILIAFALIAPIKSDNFPDVERNSFRGNTTYFIQNSESLHNSDSFNINSSNKNNSSTHQRVLSRQKRYLIFPEGSSLQVVFDQIIPIVDYNNYLILGITVALAWELPSKRPSELFSDVKEKLNDGTLGLRKDENVNDLQYNEDQNQEPYANKNEVNSHQTSDFNSQRRVFSKWDENPFYSSSKYNRYGPTYDRTYNKKPNNYYMEGGPIYYNYSNWNWQPKKQYPSIMSNVGPINNWENIKRISNTQKRRPFHSGNGGGYQTNGARKHRIYPVFGKRSTDSHRLTDEEKFHLHYHRSSRHGLYFKIEKYLQTRGINGLECVLKTLCETGQRRHEKEPDDFVREIMRAIFTIPKSIEPVADRKHRMYDEAHFHRGNCSETYPLCTGSIWDEHFLF